MKMMRKNNSPAILYQAQIDDSSGLPSLLHTCTFMYFNTQCMYYGSNLVYVVDIRVCVCLERAPKEIQKEKRKKLFDTCIIRVPTTLDS